MKKIYKFIKTGVHSIMLSLFGITFVCKQNPSCSEYTWQKIKKEGLIKGTIKGLIRFINCK